MGKLAVLEPDTLTSGGVLAQLASLYDFEVDVWEEAEDDYV